MYDIIVIGAGTAGLTAAIYGKRAGKSVLVYEGESYGGQILTAPEVANYPGIKNISGYAFATGLFEQAKNLGTEFNFDQVTGVTGSAREGFTVTSELGSNFAKTIIIACGARHRHMGIDDEERFSGVGVSYCSTCDGAFFKGRDVAVFGGGNTALEDAIYLSSICSKVYIIHRRDEFRAEQALVNTAMSFENIIPKLSYVVSGLNGNKTLESIEISSTKNDSKEEIKLSGLFVAIGQVPSNGGVSDFVELDQAGYVKASEDCVTNVPGVFVAGDGRTKAVRQLTTAAADGAISAVAACSFIAKSFL